MSKCFREGFKYVFSKKKYKKDVGSCNVYSRGWVNKCNGREVEMFFNWSGRTKVGFNVVPEWCKCIGKKETRGSAKPTCR